MTITKSETNWRKRSKYRDLVDAVIQADGKMVVLPLPDDSPETRQRMRVGVDNTARRMGERVVTEWDGENLRARLYAGPW